MKPALFETDILFICYRQAPFIKEALDSVLKQTYQNFRVLAVDDGSRDGSLEILKDYEARFPEKFRVLTHPNHENRGILETYRLGFSELSAPFTAFLEGDDVWSPENLEKKIAALKSNSDISAAFSSYRTFGDLLPAFYWKIHREVNRWGVPSRRPFDALASLLLRNPVASFSHFAARRKALERIPLPAAHGERLDWWVLAHLSLNSPFYFIPEKLSGWRIVRASAAYRRWDAEELRSLHAFLGKLYGSLKAAGACRRELETACRGWKRRNESGRGPQSLRFLAHVFLKNALLR